MKNKKSTFFGLALLLAGALVLTNCTKNKTNKEVVPDTDTEAARDVARATQMVVEINDIAAEICEQTSSYLTYTSYTPLSTSVVVTTTATSTNVLVNSSAAVVSINPFSRVHDIVFNNTIGKDGIVKNGSLRFDYSATTLPAGNPADYYRMAGYDLKVTTPTTLIWDGDTIILNNYHIFNNTTIGFPGTGSSPLQPSKGVNITWQITADIIIHKKLASTTDKQRNIKWKGTLLRTLINTNNTAVPMPPGSTVSTFTVFPPPYTGAYYNRYSYCSYSGSGSADEVSNGDNCTWEIPAEFPITRNFNSSPEAFANPVGGMLMSPQRHPFLSGVLYVDPGTKTKRKVDFGMADVVDYDAKVTIDGITYGVDMKY